ncbi:LytR/AlgR family response regulator transcription factor [Brevundimonas poindexterae]|uniref:LytR/AlgR family response regulator transcription factor n=1 Tax=Brevundimonas poindexterae TaxID=74325 RepID=UPI001CFDB9E8|nr:LytTR family DNA-binding domain-containing protein [Brevundimonas poindexterae]
MARWLILIGVLVALFATTATAAASEGWDVCDGPPGVGGTTCAPLRGPVDPQGRELWLRKRQATPTGPGPHALYLVGVASSEAWLNGQRLGRNGRPGTTRAAEQPGAYQAAFPISDRLWQPEGNTLVVHLSSFHGGLRLDYPMGAVLVAPYPYAMPRVLMPAMLLAAGALLAAAFGFGVIHAIRRTGSSLALAGMAGAAGLHAVLESVNLIGTYPYPLHIWRLVAIWSLAALFGILLVSWVTARFWPMAGRRTSAGAALLVATSLVVPGFDAKTAAALGLGLALAAAITARGVYRRQPGARAMLAWLVLILGVLTIWPDVFVNLSYFVLAACLVLPLLMVEVVRLGWEAERRETALARAAGRPDRLTVASSRGVVLVPLADIVAILGADDYVELRLVDGQTLLHAARLDALERDLSPAFVRVHRSALVNLVHLTRLEREEGRYRVHLSHGDPLPVSRGRLATVRAALDGGPEAPSA